MWSRVKDITPYLIVRVKSNDFQNQVKGVLVGFYFPNCVPHVICLFEKWG